VELPVGCYLKSEFLHFKVTSNQEHQLDFWPGWDGASNPHQFANVTHWAHFRAWSSAIYRLRIIHSC